MQVALFEDMIDDLEFLRIVAYVGTLLDFLCGLRYGDLDLHRIVEQCDGQFSDLGRHGGREHDALTTLRQFLDDFHDILDETHVEHTVGFVEHEE